MTAPRVAVTRAQVAAARGKLVTDARQGRDTPAWVGRVACADGDPAWEPGGEGLARVAAWRRRFELARRRQRAWVTLTAVLHSGRRAT